MTGPAVQGLDPRIVANLQLMQAKGLTKDIPSYLQDIEGVDPGQYMEHAGPGFGQMMLQGAGKLARAGIQGVGNMASLPFGLAGAAYQGVTGNQPPAMLQGNQGTATADQLGLPQGDTPGERMLMSGAENAVAGAILPGGATAGRMALGAGAGAAGQGAAEAGAGPMGQMAASAAVGMGIPVVSAMGAEAIRSMVVGASSRRAAAQQSAALLQAGDPMAGASLGQVSGRGGAAGTVQGGLKNVPGATEVLQRAGERQATHMQGRVSNVADQMGPGGSPMTAGATIQRGIEEGFIPRFKATANGLYQKVFAAVPPDTPIIPTQSVALATSQGNLVASARPLSDNIASPKVAGILNDLAETVSANPSGVPFQVLKDLRSRLGAMLNGDEMVADINLRDVKRLYGALSEDMRAGIAPHGPDAIKAWDRAETFWRVGSERIEKVLQPLMDKKTPEKAFAALMSGTRDGATVLRSTMQSLRPAERNLVRSTVLRRMGNATPSAPGAVEGAFSPETYLTNWNKLAPESKTALFGGTGTGGQLDDLAKAAELRRKATNVLPNRSGTAPNTAFYSIMAGLSTSVGGAVIGSPGMMAAGMAPAGAAGIANLTAKAFTSPRLIQWMVKQTKVPFGALSQELAILVKDAQKWPAEDQETAQNLASTLSGLDWNKILLAHAAADATTRRTP